MGGDAPEFSDILDALQANQADTLIQNGLIGKYGAPITKMLLTKHGYKDESDIASGGAPIASSYRACLFGRELLRSGLASQLPSPKLANSATVILDICRIVACGFVQALVDLGDQNRQSFRGPALELREALREALDHLAPDKDVMGAPGFTAEEGRTKPTTKQKVRFILRARGITKSGREVPEDAANAIDELIGELTRSVQNLSSIATHVATARTNVRRVKRYIDAVLHDILELG